MLTQIKDGKLVRKGGKGTGLRIEPGAGRGTWNYPLNFPEQSEEIRVIFSKIILVSLKLCFLLIRYEKSSSGDSGKKIFIVSLYSPEMNCTELGKQ